MCHLGFCHKIGLLLLPPLYHSLPMQGRVKLIYMGPRKKWGLDHPHISLIQRLHAGAQQLPQPPVLHTLVKTLCVASEQGHNGRPLGWHIDLLACLNWARTACMSLVQGCPFQTTTRKPHLAFISGLARKNKQIVLLFISLICSLPLLSQ